MKVGYKIELPDNKRDLSFNRIGGLKVEILEIYGRHNHLAKVKIIATGTITDIVL